MGFSLVGTAIAAMLLLPNFLPLFFPPKNRPAAAKDACLIFTLLERVGQGA